MRAAREAGCRDLVLLKCTSTYPATPENTNIRTIPHLRELFGCEVGLSDHTMGIGVVGGQRRARRHASSKSTSRCARADGGVDSAFSLEPRGDGRAGRRDRARLAGARAASPTAPTAAEKKSLAFRRSLYVVEDLQRRRRADAPEPARDPARGLACRPSISRTFLGRPVAADVERGTPLAWELIRAHKA